VLIRGLTAENIPRVACLFEELARHVRDESRDPYFDFDELAPKETAGLLQSSLCDPNKIVIVAEEGSDIVGFIAGEILDCFLSVSSVKKIGYISAAYVMETKRQKGCMKALVREIETFFRGKGIRWMELHVLSMNRSGKAAWEKLGFRTFREQMRKEISRVGHV
jgi:ribosomal protein S18 acetylase RimI-like enzyme